MTAHVSSARTGSIRSLIGELAQLEDAARSMQTHARLDAAGAEPVLDPDLVKIAKRQAEVVSALRGAAGQLRQWA